MTSATGNGPLPEGIVNVPESIPPGTTTEAFSSCHAGAAANSITASVTTARLRSAVIVLVPARVGAANRLFD